MSDPAETPLSLTLTIILTRFPPIVHHRMSDDSPFVVIKGVRYPIDTSFHVDQSACVKYHPSPFDAPMRKARERRHRERAMAEAHRERAMVEATSYYNSTVTQEGIDDDAEMFGCFSNAVEAFSEELPVKRGLDEVGQVFSEGGNRYSINSNFSTHPISAIAV